MQSGSDAFGGLSNDYIDSASETNSNSETFSVKGKRALKTTKAAVSNQVEKILHLKKAEEIYTRLKLTYSPPRITKEKFIYLYKKGYMRGYHLTPESFRDFADNFNSSTQNMLDFGGKLPISLKTAIKLLGGDTKKGISQEHIICLLTGSEFEGITKKKKKKA